MEPGFEHSRSEKDYGYRIKWGIEVLARLSRATILFIFRDGRGVAKKQKGSKGAQKRSYDRSTSGYRFNWGNISEAGDPFDAVLGVGGR
jgi:hypothetical protein